jgi:hypothetical protein
MIYKITTEKVINKAREADKPMEEMAGVLVFALMQCLISLEIHEGRAEIISADNPLVSSMEDEGIDYCWGHIYGEPPYILVRRDHH